MAVEHAHFRQARASPDTECFSAAAYRAGADFWVVAAQPDAGVPKNAVQKFGRRLAVLWRGLTSASGIFALKFGIVSIALWVPAVCPSSAWFYYTNR